MDIIADFLIIKLLGTPYVITNLEHCHRHYLLLFYLAQKIILSRSDSWFSYCKIAWWILCYCEFGALLCWLKVFEKWSGRLAISIVIIILPFHLWDYSKCYDCVYFWHALIRWWCWWFRWWSTDGVGNGGDADGLLPSGAGLLLLVV